MGEAEVGYKEIEWETLGGCMSRVERVEERGVGSRVERVDRVERVEMGVAHLLYLGRRHPLKGVGYLEEAVRQLNSNLVNPVNPVRNSSTRSTCSTRLNKENSSLHVSTRSTRLKQIMISTRFYTFYTVKFT